MFAYLFHFGQSGFSAYFFTPNLEWISRFYPDFFCAGPHSPLYCLTIVSDTGYFADFLHARSQRVTRDDQKVLQFTTRYFN